MSKTPSHSTPRYVCARLRAIFKAQGWPLHKLTGRYQPFCNTQTGTEGYYVHRVGCSKSVAIGYSAAYGQGRSRDLPLGVAAEKKKAAITLLRDLGYRIDHIGWIECEHYD